MDFSAVKQDALGQSCFSRVDVRGNPDIANEVNIPLICHAFASVFRAASSEASQS
jgi:hypothetical protein